MILSKEWFFIHSLADLLFGRSYAEECFGLWFVGFVSIFLSY